ncbi:GNAT family N-acetyltransferase [Parerythrobacter jejuensis]|uniref:GNAT family N-acetyltransferase n=1 Tax=Parerythrobacter jejuensis TaxID=795812 RepID=A0A845AUQ9_9SPHN|nr:GNAT family N-acetyltransferase [Parerythrobacter jejuensis]MXP32805.1 GNAT family N-acetyltransferase [Parerythrobacter jejuensis]
MKDDLDRIMHVMDAAFDPAWGEAWNRRQVEGSLVLPTTFYRLLNSEGNEALPGEKPAAFAMVRAAPGEEELLLIAVHPTSRRRGLGGLLVELLATDAKARGSERLFLEMRENNTARTLYESHGFIPIGRRKDYYKAADGTRLDAITYARTL